MQHQDFPTYQKGQVLVVYTRPALLVISSVALPSGLVFIYCVKHRTEYEIYSSVAELGKELGKE